MTNPAEGVRRGVYVGLGLFFVGIGVVGVFLPGLPTTIFLLAAAWFFARSSPRLHRWLWDHPRLGAYLRMANDRAMPMRAKLVTVAFIWAGVALSVVSLAHRPGQILIVLLGAIGTYVVGFRFRTLKSAPSRPVA